MPHIYLLDHPHLPISPNHRFFLEKFASGFAFLGYAVHSVRKTEEISGPGFVVISVEGLEAPEMTSAFVRLYHRHQPILLKELVRHAKKIGAKEAAMRYFGSRNKKKAFSVIEALAKKEGIVGLCWYFSNYVEELESLGLKYILTGEYYAGKPATEKALALYRWYGHKKCLPIKFSAAVNPESLGRNSKNEKIFVSYVGNKSYRLPYYSLFLGNPRCKIILTPPYISEEKRIAVYEDSVISLGLHSDDNIQNHVVVERVFEALAYGALSLSDHPDAPAATGNIARCVRSPEELLELAEHYRRDRAAREDLREKGFAFIRSSGTYAHRAQEFVDRARELYGIL